MPVLSNDIYCLQERNAVTRTSTDKIYLTLPNSEQYLTHTDKIYRTLPNSLQYLTSTDTIFYYIWLTPTPSMYISDSPQHFSKHRNYWAFCRCTFCNRYTCNSFLPQKGLSILSVLVRVTISYSPQYFL